MLAEQGVTSNWKWEDANRVIQNDTLARYNVFRTMADRKQAFVEYQNELRVREREELREHREETRQNFIKLLEENRFQLSFLSKYFQIQKKVCYDIRWKGCDEKDREELFQDFIDRLGEEDKLIKKQ